MYSVYMYYDELMLMNKSIESEFTVEPYVQTSVLVLLICNTYSTNSQTLMRVHTSIHTYIGMYIQGE